MFLQHKNKAASAIGTAARSPQANEAGPHFRLESFDFSERDLLRMNSP